MTEEISSAVFSAAPGRRIAGYQIEEELGRGGMAIVYRARDINLGRIVALKILAPQLASDDSFRQRFIQESRAAAAVDHPPERASVQPRRSESKWRRSAIRTSRREASVRAVAAGLARPDRLQ